LNKEDAESYLKELKELEGTCPYLNFDLHDETLDEEEIDKIWNERLTWETNNLPEGFRIGNNLSIEEVNSAKETQMATEIFIVCNYAGHPSSSSYVELIAFDTKEDAIEFQKIVSNWFNIKSEYTLEKIHEWKQLCPFPGLIDDSFHYQLDFIIKSVKLVSNLKELK
jgi:hypothetical protein